MNGLGGALIFILLILILRLVSLKPFVTYLSLMESQSITWTDWIMWYSLKILSFVKYEEWATEANSGVHISSEKE